MLELSITPQDKHDVLIDWLNDNNEARLPRHKETPSSSRAKIKRLVESILKAQRLIESTPAGEKPPAEFGVEVRAANRILRTQAFHYDLELIQGTKSQWSLHMSSKAHDVTKAEMLANMALRWFLENGDITAVRMCACGSYFRAKRKNQEFCSGKCRHKKYEQTDESKEKRRVYMREYYHLKKSGKVK